jgi:cellobiose dehydrogenase (acceptor)
MGWFDAYNMTWFDIPRECNRIWNRGSVGIACTDTGQMVGCVLGGGTVVNATLWWKPNPSDWNVNFPAGWKIADIANATNQVFSHIPETDHSSTDGKRYLQDGFNLIRNDLSASGWKEVTANDVPAEKNRTFAHTPHMFSGGERGGPLAIYLVSANPYQLPSMAEHECGENGPYQTPPNWPPCCCNA